MDCTELFALGARVGDRLAERGETVAVAEGSCGGLISAALLARPGASAYYLGGGVIYTGRAAKGLVAGEIEPPPGMRGASEPFVRYLAESIALRHGATGPSGNPYGDPAGHGWAGVHGPVPATRHTLTGDDDRTANMAAFARVALQLLDESLRRAGQLA